jgi:hypothetical protein
MPTEFGPYIGVVVNNIDNTRQGRLQVWIEEFGAVKADGSPDLSDETLWRTVKYCPPFYGATPLPETQGDTAGVGSYPGNRNSYGMWFTPPDLGTRVICFFVAGDPDKGYYFGCIPEQGINHMIPAIGSSSKYVPGNKTQQNYFTDTPLLPVTEISTTTKAINENPRFFDQPKPVQSVQAAILFQQGLNKDPVRGPIRSSSQRESPSNVYGISTPGKAIYQGGLDPKTIKGQLEKGEIKPQDITVIGRQGGHTFVMDDGDLEGTDTLVRIRTAKGHQITMSDDGDCFYITHANGQTWLEFGKQGTVDVYSTNSINLRTQGTLNFHADRDINMYAGGRIRMKTKGNFLVESEKTLALNGTENLVLFSKTNLSIRSDGNLAMRSKTGAWNSASTLNFKGATINLNGAPTLPTSTVPSIPLNKLVGTKFSQQQGWTVVPGAVETIVTRAPTHEPYPYHNQGVNVTTNLNESVTSEANPDNQTDTDQTAEQEARSNRAYAQAETQTVKDPIKAEDYAKEPSSDSGVGNVSADEVTALTAQQAKETAAKTEEFVGTPYDDDGNLNPGWTIDGDENPYYTGPEISKTGIGTYGQSAESLVQLGYLKPGTLNLVTQPSLLSTVLSSPNVWTGQYGVSGLLDYISQPILQNLGQISLMSSALQGLFDKGVLSGDESSRYQATFLQPATVYGVDAVAAWVNNEETDTELLSNILITARQAQYAVDFTEIYSDVLQIANNLPGFVNTVERTEIDQAVTDIIDNPKIPSIDYIDAPVPLTPVVQVNVPDRPRDDSVFRFAPGKPKA